MIENVNKAEVFTGLLLTRFALPQQTAPTSNSYPPKLTLPIITEDTNFWHKQESDNFPNCNVLRHHAFDEKTEEIEFQGNTLIACYAGDKDNALTSDVFKAFANNLIINANEESAHANKQEERHDPIRINEALNRDGNYKWFPFLTINAFSGIHTYIAYNAPLTTIITDAFSDFNDTIIFPHRNKF